MRRCRWVWLAVLSSRLAGCIPGLASGPTVINHPQPELAIPSFAFEEVGCSLSEYGTGECSSESPVAALGCRRVSRASDLLGGLEPSYPIAECWVEPYRHEDPFSVEAQVEADGYLYRNGCLSPRYVRYIAQPPEGLRLLGTAEAFREAFAPIESPEEALSFALAVTGLSAYFGLEARRGFRYFADEMEDTHVVEVEGGYLVHLYHYQFCGCGPHTTSAIDVRVTTGGDVVRVSQEVLYEDPAEDDLCVD
jgi:hypothetical protein